jgi:hypothetical protein
MDQLLAQRHPRVVQAALERADFDADQVGGILGGEPFDVAQDEHFAERLREREDGGLQEFPDLARVGLRIGLRLVRRYGRGLGLL